MCHLRNNSFDAISASATQFPLPSCGFRIRAAVSASGTRFPHPVRHFNIGSSDLVALLKHSNWLTFYALLTQYYFCSVDKCTLASQVLVQLNPKGHERSTVTTSKMIQVKHWVASSKIKSYLMIHTCTNMNLRNSKP